MQNDANDSRTNGHESTEGVPDGRSTRGVLRKVRDAHGAHSEIGHLCSDLMEASENFEKSADEEQRKHLRANIVRWMADLDSKLREVEYRNRKAGE